MRFAYHRRFSYQGICNQRRLDFHGAKTMSRDIQDIVDPPHDPEVTVEVAVGAIAGEIVLTLEVVWVIGLLEALGITPDGADHRRPGTLDDEDPAFAFLH